MRLLLPLLVVVAMAACGSDQDPTLAVPSTAAGSSSSTSPSTTAASVPPPAEDACTGEEPGVGDDLTLGVAHGELRSGAAVAWSLMVTNGGDTPVELVFGTGQDGDVVLTEGQDEVYRWSADMAFTQAVRCQVLPPGGSATYELAQPVLDVEPGQYQLRASLASTPKPFDVATQVTVE